MFLKYLILQFLLFTIYSWDYSQQYNWPDKCKGLAQSPIRIPAIDTLPESEVRYILEYAWYNPSIPSRLMDNGHNLIVFFDVRN